jgi:2-keto-3-deoxy-L-rhamnonate aldolase RhmA
VEAGDFPGRLKAGADLYGTFVKTPGVHALEMLGDVGLDFAILDEEHAPIGRETMEVMILAALASGLAPIVRVGEPSDFAIMSPLDSGAAGVFVPHIDSVAKAEQIAAACRYRGGRRGFYRGGRAGGYGRGSTAEHIARQDGSVLCIPMIEEPEGVGAIDGILAVRGVDAVFIGRGDLSVAMGAEGPNAPEVEAAVDRILAAARAAGKPAIALTTGADDQRRLRAAGVRAFAVDSDQGFLRSAAAEALARCRAVATETAA